MHHECYYEKRLNLKTIQNCSAGRIQFYSNCFTGIPATRPQVCLEDLCHVFSLNVSKQAHMIESRPGAV